MSLTADQLFALLPAVYRTRDAEGGGQLQALFAVMAAQSAIVEDNINQLYDDQFIETCAPWVIPYIADLLGYNSIYEITAADSDSRAEVANTIGYRRRKGTLLALEQLSMDVSGGRAALMVEEFRHLITTQSLRHPRPGSDATVNLRCGQALDLIGTPFDVQNRTIDVRGITPRARPPADPDATPVDIALHGAGVANIPDIAIHLWRWQNWPVTNAPATPVSGDARRYRFSPLGNDTPLFSQPAARKAFSHLTTRNDVPLPIGRHELAMFYGKPPNGSILLTADDVDVDVDQVYGANLADRPGGSWCTVARGKIAIDPELGRIQYAADLQPPQKLRLTYSYGAAAAIGGGPYPRAPLPTGTNFEVTVGGSIGSIAPTLEDAVTQWNTFVAHNAAPTGLITLPPGFESLTLTDPLTVQLPAGSTLTIGTESGSLVTISGDGPVGQVGVHIEVACSSPDASGQQAPEALGPGQLVINGVRIAGQLSVTGNGPSGIQVVDSTFVPGLALGPDAEPLSPGDPSISVTADGVSLSLERVISGPIVAHSSGSTQISDSIIDATSPYYVAYSGTDLASAGADLQVKASTVIGKVHTRTLTLASNTIFHARLGNSDPWARDGAAIWASRRQSGCVRFCVLPFGSITPRRYGCLPPDAASESALEPRFITLRYGLPAYAMLSGDVPMAIWTGAYNGSQMGAYLQIQETEAVSNVQLRVPEYLPALLESGIFIHPSRASAEFPGLPTAYGYGYQRPYGLPADPPGIGAGLI